MVVADEPPSNELDMMDVNAHDGIGTPKILLPKKVDEDTNPVSVIEKPPLTSCVSVNDQADSGYQEGHRAR